MTIENSKGSKHRARELQRQTGWSYMECKRCIEKMTKDEIAELIESRRKPGAEAR